MPHETFSGPKNPVAHFFKLAVVICNHAGQMLARQGLFLVPGIAFQPCPPCRQKGFYRMNIHGKFIALARRSFKS
jgi:hypothetical protein